MTDNTGTVTVQDRNCQLVENNARVIEAFLMSYLSDVGIDVQMIEVIAKELFGQTVKDDGTVPKDVATTPKELFSSAMQDVLKFGVFGNVESFDLQRVIDGATYNRSGNTATLTCNATINGQPTTYTMQLTDDPANGDSFSIQTGSGYSGGGTLVNGDVVFLR